MLGRHTLSMAGRIVTSVWIPLNTLVVIIICLILELVNILAIRIVPNTLIYLFAQILEFSSLLRAYLCSQRTLMYSILLNWSRGRFQRLLLVHPFN